MTLPTPARLLERMRQIHAADETTPLTKEAIRDALLASRCSMACCDRVVAGGKAVSFAAYFLACFAEPLERRAAKVKVRP